MPELPEVETVRRGIEPAAVGRTIRDLRFTPEGERLLMGVPAAAFSDAVRGRQIEAVQRRGKYLLFALDDGRYFVAHLRMTGRLEVEPEAAEPGRFLRAAILLDDGNELRWRDARRFGTWQVIDNLSELQKKLGPEPLEAGWTAAVLKRSLAGRRSPIKSVLLDQRRVAGLGNIYVDEGLHAARIHPLRPAGSLSDDEIGALRRSMQAVLRKGIRNSGTTLRDFVNAYGSRGRNKESLQVYQRADEPCYRCGAAIQRIVVGGRGTHFCPSCQAEPPAEGVVP